VERRKTMDSKKVIPLASKKIMVSLLNYEEVK